MPERGWQGPTFSKKRNCGPCQPRLGISLVTSPSNAVTCGCVGNQRRSCDAERISENTWGRNEQRARQSQLLDAVLGKFAGQLFGPSVLELGLPILPGSIDLSRKTDWRYGFLAKLHCIGPRHLLHRTVRSFEVARSRPHHCLPMCLSDRVNR